ncbi:MAG: hypothetical protein K6E18_07090, partial [Lachnospiraceae bacterium]|nr:hypothetical protein [Lachnospiraceae bacterium]
MTDDQTINTIREQKRALRKEILAIRDALDVAVRKQESEAVRKKIAKLPAFCKAQRVLLFASYGSEIETDGIIEDALA